MAPLLGAALLAGAAAAQEDGPSGAAAPGAAQAAGATGPGRLIFVASDPAEGRPGTVQGELSVLQLPALPDGATAGLDVLSALLRANPVSTFVSAPGSAGLVSGDLSLVIDLALGAASEGAQTSVTIGGETMPVSALEDRLGALMSAFDPEAAQMAFLRIEDPDDRFPGALTELQSAFQSAGFAMSVAMIGAGGTCEAARPALHYEALAGLPDRTPFGDADGTVTVAEAEGYIRAALERQVHRGAGCAARYSLILSRGDGPDQALVSVPQAPLLPEMESAVYLEEFEALFLASSEDAAAIEEYLQTCAYCPGEASLAARLTVIEERAMALRLETGVWETIRADETPGRLEIYLANCQLCAFEDEAGARIAALREAAAARADENAAFERLVAARDLPGLQAWLASCIACDNAAAAEAEIEALQTDSVFQEEQARLEEALARRNASMIGDWLETCEICGGREGAEATLARLSEEATAAGPCLALAGLPQQGGPRLLADIDQAAAERTCRAALTSYPGSPVVATALGRVAQAAEDLDAARNAYRAGVEAGLPEAHGLLAHLTYAPGPGEAADYAAAEELALAGLDLGDWLSGEVLTVLYSRGLIDGRTAEDAYAIARAQAEAGNPAAQFFAGYFHRTGQGAEQSDRLAEEWFARAVEQGYTHANSFLAELYERGGEGIEPDPARAADLYWSALELGDETARGRLTDGLDGRTNAVVAEIQTRLRDAGVFAGRIDGIGGTNTARSVDAFFELQEAG